MLWVRVRVRVRVRVMDIRYGPLISWPPTPSSHEYAKLQALHLGRRYIPPETKLLKFCRPNIAKIMFFVSDKNTVFVFGVRFTFLFDSKNSRAQE